MKRPRLALPALCAALALALSLALPSLAAASPKLLSVSLAGAKSGTVTSSPTGIECGSKCSASFAEGASVTLAGSPGAGAGPAQWSGCDSIDAEDRCRVAMSGPRSVTASFEAPDYALTLTKAGDGTGTVTSSPAGIECGAKCAHSYPEGTAVTLSAAPAPGSEAVIWSGCDAVLEGKCEVAMSTARNVTATFSLPRFSLTVIKAGAAGPYSSVSSSPAGIQCGASCSASFLQGASLTLTATPPPQGKAVLWSGCAAVTGHPNECKVTMSETHSVTATFELKPGYGIFPLTIEKTGSGQGTVASDSGPILCGAICSGQFIAATSLTLTATPAPGSVFTRWSGGGCSGAGPCTTTLLEATTLKATFTAVGTRPLSVSHNGQGTVTARAFGIECPSACSAQVPVGKRVTLAAKPDKGASFAHWSGACSGTAKTCSVTMSEARSLTATFTGPPAAAAAAPAGTRCVVPRLTGRSLRAARAALAAAHCSLGKVSRPKARNGRVPHPLVVRRFSPEAGAVLPAGGKVDLRLGRARGPKRAG